MPDLPLPRFTGGAVGYLSYEAVRAFEPRVPSAPGPGLGLPDGVWMLTDALLVFDHLARTIKAVAHVVLDDDVPSRRPTPSGSPDRRVDRAPRAPQPTMPHGGELSDSPAEERQIPNTTRERYLEMVETAREYIEAGDIFQVVLSQRVDVPSTSIHSRSTGRCGRSIRRRTCSISISSITRSSARRRSCWSGWKVDVTNHPIAGTRPRGATPEEDDALARDLLADEKERAEHVMLVDLGRNDVGRVSAPGTVACRASWRSSATPT